MIIEGDQNMKRALKDYYNQIDNRKYVEDMYGKEQWVQVSGHCNCNNADAAFWCGLIDKRQCEKAFIRPSWDITKGSGGPGFEGIAGQYDYKRVLLQDGLEPLLYYREFYGVRPNYVELAQEFILLNDLYYDQKKKSFWAMLENGEFEEAVKYEENGLAVFIKLKYLLKYAAAKQMAVLLFFDIRAQFDGKLSDYQLKPFEYSHKSEDLFYEIHGDEIEMQNCFFSILMGKRVLYPKPIESCGYWPFEKEREYEEFIIGADEMGNEIKHTCNPDRLNNYFGSNPGAPMYLTPVFFKKEVLQKYLSKPQLYEIRDGYLECQSLWRIAIDNHHKNCISAYLGDLGRDLPEGEQAYWKSFNILSDERLSRVSFQRDFLCMPAKSDMADHIFQQDYLLFSKKWKEQYDWDFFLPLSETDQYNFNQIHIPITDSQPEFDQLVLSLVKVLIDSLNEKELQNQLGESDSLKGISKLEKWLELQGKDDYSDHIKFLRDLQELRSTGTGHRKGKAYNKIAQKFGVGDSSLSDVFESILQTADGFLNYLSRAFLK